MTGDDLRSRLKLKGVVFADLARDLGISAQDLNSKLKAKKISAELLERINKIVYNIDETTENENEGPIKKTDFVEYLIKENAYLKQKLDSSDEIIHNYVRSIGHASSKQA